MKTASKILKLIPLGIILLITSANSFGYQDNIEGHWEGMFMQQFRMEILFSLNMEDVSGRIKMYDGSLLIQDDEINHIQYEDNSLSFLIPAKETAFKGQLNSDHSELKGDFIFPDGSRHPVSVAKKTTNSASGNSLSSNDRDILEKKYSPSQLKEDLQFLRNHLAEIHPQYHLYSTEETYEALYHAADINLDRDLTFREFYNMTSPIVGKVGCSHTGIRLPEEYIKAQHAHNNYFPIKLYIKDDKAWALSGIEDQDDIDPGSEIISINHVPVENIITILLSFIPAEGYNKSTKYYEINKDFGSYFNLLNNSQQFLIEYIKPGFSKVDSKNIEAISYSSYSSGNNVNMSFKPILHPLIMEQKTAVLEIPSFACPDVNEYLNLMDSIFQEIQKAGIRNLVLDLRGNHGGHPIFAAILYSYLTHVDFTYFQRNEDITEFEPLYEPMEPAKNNFKGKCYAIVDGGCLSTTGHLISLLRYNNRAVFIGEEPGSWFYCNDNSKQFKLPNTRIEVNIPQTTFETAVKGYKMGESFIVDYALELSLEDVKLKTDPWVEYTLNLIRISDRSL